MGFLFHRGKNTTTRADMIADFQINTASYGEVVPEILGTTRVSGNIIDYEDFTAHEHSSTTRTGKGGGGSSHTEITYTYTVAAAIALCEGPIAGVGKVWRDKEIYTYPSEKIELTLFNGEQGQAPWPYMVSKHPDKALPYSGLAYMAGVVDLGERGSLPQFNFEIMGKLRDTGDGIDVNPADYIEHVLQSVGADVQIEGIENYRAYCRAADILISTPPEQKSAKAQSIINDIAEITNSLVFWSTDRLKIVPLADKPVGDWTPENQIQYDLTADDFIAGTDGQLEFTAEGKPAGTYAPARYDVHENERPFVDYNQEAPSVNDVAIFQTAGDVGGNQVFIGVNAPSGWGGCSVWLSDNDENYSRVGSITQQARMGRTLTTLSNTGDGVSVKLNQGSMKGGTHIDAERANTLSWIDGEALSYEGAQLQTDGSYKLTGLVRGQYATIPTDHASGARFIRIDEALYRHSYRKEDIGKTVYLKFTSMNLFGTNEQGLDEVQAYPYKIVPYYIPEVSNLALYTKYYEIGNGVLSFDVVAQFDVPRLNSLDTVELWYREQGGTWKYGGAGEGLITVSGCELGHTYDVKIQVKDTHGNTSQGLTKSITVEMKSEIPNAPQGFSVSFGDMAHFNWLEVRNADVDYYEIRSDLSAGQNDGLIGRSNNTTFSTLLTERTAKVYCIAHNPAKGYGAPAELTYNIPIPKQPTKVKATANISGIGVTFEPIPVNCKGANVYIDDNVYYITTNAINVPLKAGVYAVQVAYVDMFGEGPRSSAENVAVKAKIDKSLLDMESIGLDGIDKAVNDLKGEVGTVKTAVNGMDSKIIDLGNAYQRTLSDYQNNVNSQITQISSGIELKVTEAMNSLDGAELVSRINLSPAGTRIDGKLLHVTGEALFDNNIIAKGMIQAGAITADKMQVDSLSSITATIGTLRTKTSGARVEISDDLIQVFDENNQLRVRIGIWE